jgi:hypothetical protein
MTHQTHFLLASEPFAPETALAGKAAADQFLEASASLGCRQRNQQCHTEATASVLSSGRDREISLQGLAVVKVDTARQLLHYLYSKSAEDVHGLLRSTPVAFASFNES